MVEQREVSYPGWNHLFYPRGSKAKTGLLIHKHLPMEIPPEPSVLRNVSVSVPIFVWRN